jgi:hypothetical protein
MVVIRESLRELSVWRVVRFFPYMVYIGSSHRDTFGYE